MAWLKANWRVLGLGAVVGALAALLVDLVLVGLGKPLWSQEAAGWAQAFGTVGAIYATWAISTRQQAVARRQAKERDHKFIGTLAMIVEDIECSAQEVIDALNGRDKPAMMASLKKITEAEPRFVRLRELPIGDWPSAFLAVSFQNVWDRAAQFRGATGNVFDAWVSDMGAGKIATKQAKIAERALASAILDFKVWAKAERLSV